MASTDQVRLSDGSLGPRWQPNDLSPEIAYAEVTANTTQTGVGNTDVSGLAVTFTTDGVQKVLVTVYAPQITNSNVAGVTNLNLKEGATVLQIGTAGVLPAGSITPILMQYRITPSAGAHTYKVNLQQATAGNSQLLSGATFPAFIRVEAC